MDTPVGLNPMAQHSHVMGQVPQHGGAQQGMGMVNMGYTGPPNNVSQTLKRLLEKSTEKYVVFKKIIFSQRRFLTFFTGPGTTI